MKKSGKLELFLKVSYWFYFWVKNLEGLRVRLPDTKILVYRWLVQGFEVLVDIFIVKV